MSQLRNVAYWLLLYAFPRLVISLSSPEIAPAISLQSVFEAPGVVERVSDSYTLEAFVWRDAQPLVVTGTMQALQPLLPFALLALYLHCSLMSGLLTAIAGAQAVSLLARPRQDYLMLRLQ